MFWLLALPYVLSRHPKRGEKSTVLAAFTPKDASFQKEDDDDEPNSVHGFANLDFRGTGNQSSISREE
jgi:hypothetical protein